MNDQSASAGVTQSVRNAAAVIGSAKSIVTVGHIRPDGDALGSALAIALAAREAGITAHSTFGDPFTIPHQFRYLNTAPITPVADVPTPADLLVACDVATQARLGTAAAIAGEVKQVLVIDHHISNDGFGDVHLIVPTAAATAELAYMVIRELGWQVTPEVAAALYTGLVTDTGRFQYSVTSPAVHRIVADLIECGVRPELVGRHLYEESPFGYLHVAGQVLARAELDEEKSFVWSVLLDSDLREANIGGEDADGLIDLIRLAREAGVACLLKVDDGVVKGSLRSRGAVDVSAIAAHFGGGGHHNASGFTYEGTVEDATAIIRGML